MRNKNIRYIKLSLCLPNVRKYSTTLPIYKNRINSVIALGGGAFLNNSIRRAVKSNSISFWLDVKTDTLINRLKKNKKRPLLFKKNLLETVKKIYLERKKTYSEADFRISCDLLKPTTISDKILNLYENLIDNNYKITNSFKEV